MQSITLRRVFRVFCAANLASCAVLVTAFGAFSASAKADTISDYVTYMQSNQPDVTADPYIPNVTSSQASFTDDFDMYGEETGITIFHGPDASMSTYYTAMSASTLVVPMDINITLNSMGDPTGGTITQYVSLDGTTTSLMFSGTLLPGGFGTTSTPTVPYFFLFTENVSTFYAPAGAVIGGLVVANNLPLVNGDEQTSDIKEYVITPLPGVMQSELLLLGGLVGLGGYRRLQKSPARA